MEKHQISPEKITKPIQLLGAWLVGLLAVDASFLFAATNMGTDAWQSSALTIAAIANVPIFIGALFLLQTKFRPELQEDSFYSTYLNRKTNEVVKISKIDVQFEEMEKKFELLESRQAENLNLKKPTSLSTLSYGVNTHISNQEEITSRLWDIGVNQLREFGEKLPPPNSKIVSIAERVSDELRDEILTMASQLGFEHYSTIFPFEDLEEDVLFGAYGDAEGRIIKKKIKFKPSEK
ncbi:hypothetical protein [Janthinobacterium sp. 78]|uniref:hypothetical protein n=1 Tax=Janthinobacterium sp. 78 TaxID=2135631 RepID=UPI000D5D0672|nr:hypothetical protein [Janthinobacterium sp. 78]PVX35029.1 hypothetical protein C8C92_1601 [Janthinobacterium sp. 78]